MIHWLKNHKDLLRKIDHDWVSFLKNPHPYKAFDITLWLNAIPDWILAETELSCSLHKIASEKNNIMKGNSFVFDWGKVYKDIDHSLRCIRMLSNHIKHGNDKGISLQAYYPATRPYVLLFKGNCQVTLIIESNTYDYSRILDQAILFRKNVL